MIMKTYIYALTAEVGIDTILPGIFYIGRTADISRRESQHRAAAKNPVNTEHKYQHIRALTALGHDFKLEVIAELDNFDEFSERYFIHQAILGGAKLTNMKPGDAGIYARISPTVTLHNFKAAWLAAVAEDLAAREEEARRVSAALNATIREQLDHPAVTSSKPTEPTQSQKSKDITAIRRIAELGKHRLEMSDDAINAILLRHDKRVHVTYGLACIIAGAGAGALDVAAQRAFRAALTPIT